MTRALLAFVALSSVACLREAPDLTPVPGQTNFTAVGWNAFYHRDDAGPAIEWRKGASLDCAEGRGFIAVSGNCRGGAYVPGDDFVSLALTDAGPSASDVCHEFHHVWRYRMGLPDPDDHSAFDYSAVNDCAKDLRTLGGLQ